MSLTSAREEGLADVELPNPVGVLALGVRGRGKAGELGRATPDILRPNAVFLKPIILGRLKASLRFSSAPSLIGEAMFSSTVVEGMGLSIPCLRLPFSPF